MFYTNIEYKNELLEIQKDTFDIIDLLNTNPTIENKKIQSDLRISLVLKITGIMEVWFDDICYEFAIKNSSKIFYNYFHEHFTKNGKGVKPDNINGILKSLGASPIKKNEIKVSYEVVSNLYNIRDSVAHGELSFSQTLEDVNSYVNDVITYVEKIIESLDTISYK